MWKEMLEAEDGSDRAQREQEPEEEPSSQAPRGSPGVDNDRFPFGSPTAVNYDTSARRLSGRLGLQGSRGL